MTGTGALSYLKLFCDDMDLKAKISRTLAIAAVPAAASFAVACYAAPMEGPFLEDAYTCGDGIDNDEDGQTDCDDSDCSILEGCMTHFEGDILIGSCDDGEDNDGNGTTDCDDVSCASGEFCDGDDACTDDLDNDGDGLSDCDDPDCGRQPVCN